MVEICKFFGKKSDIVLVFTFVALARFAGMEAHKRRLHTLIAGMALTDTGDIVDGLGTSHIAVFHDRVVVILGGCEFQYIGRHIGPTVRVTTVALGKGHRVADMERTTIITGEHEVGALVVVADVGEGLLQFLDEFGSSSDVGLGVIEHAPGDAEVIGRARHDLHQTLGPCEGDGLRIERRLLVTLGCHQAPVPADILTVGDEVLVVMGDDATLLVEHRREDATTHFLRGQQRGFLLLHLSDQRRTVPLLKFFLQVLLLLPLQFLLILIQ